MDDLIKYGEVQRGTIPGITVQSLTTQIAEQLGAPNTRGALVVGIQQRSDAYAAGLRPGDIIVSFNGTPIDDASQFVRLLSDAKIGIDRDARCPIASGNNSRVKVPIVKATAPPPPAGSARRDAVGESLASGRTRRRCRPRYTATPRPSPTLIPMRRRPGDLPRAAARDPRCAAGLGQVAVVLPRARCRARASGCPGRGTVPLMRTPAAGAAGAARAPPSHQRFPFERLERANQHRRRPALRLRSRRSRGSGCRN